ncbi:replicative DNA helicase [Mycoplasma suis]|uniref:DNA 5'-3' helicase n=1 Tax=Mycoplasma suis (strain Illinois) TaxID=768700 RepID=F0QQ01_MYCSL|nr:DnaB-like helicase C-terminal domain-containing protein [Mycoplasma suis]ADX97571.1 Replicative DNA helicase, DnaB [Mycoplasma suis str. Illinois]
MSFEVEKAEKAVLSSYIYHYLEIINFAELESVPLEFFVREEARAIFKVLLEMEVQSKGYDPILIYETLKRQNNIDFLNRCSRYLEELPRESQYINFKKYLSILQTNWIKKQLSGLTIEIQNTSLSHNNIDEFLQKWHESFIDITTKNSKLNYLISSEVIKCYEELVRRNQNNKNITFLRTGFPVLDAKIRGLKPGQFIVIASRPGVGKTTFALNLIENNLSRVLIDKEQKLNPAIGVFSLEMTNESIMEKLIALRSKMELFKLHRIMEDKSIHNEDWATYTAAKEDIGKTNLLFCDDTNITINKIISTIKFWNRKYDLKVVIIDYLQLINLPLEKELNSNITTHQKISLISRQLKILSIELDVCILSLSQLNRKLEERKGMERVPVLSDLRDSGSIEQDADIVMFLYPFIQREEKFNRRDDDEDDEFGFGEIEEYSAPEIRSRSEQTVVLKIGKNRHGPIGSINFKFEKEFGKFSISR